MEYFKSIQKLKESSYDKSSKDYIKSNTNQNNM